MDTTSITKNPWGHSLLNILLTITIIGVLGIAGFFGHKGVQIVMDMRKSQEMVLSNLRIINEQQVVSEIVHAKLGNKLPTDQRARIAFEIYDGCRRNGLPLHLVLGLIEQESTWNPRALSSMGAVGLMQCMPDTAIRHFKQRGLAFSIEALYDPVLNVSIGLDILLDKQETALAQGKATKDDYIYALYYYCGKGDTYAREVVARSVSYREKLDTPVQEILRKAQEQKEMADLVKTLAIEKGNAKRKNS